MAAVRCPQAGSRRAARRMLGSENQAWMLFGDLASRLSNRLYGACYDLQ